MNRNTHLVAAAIMLIVLSVESCRPAKAQPWALAWSDEFDGAAGSRPDPAKWGFETGGGGWGNDELEYYTDHLQNANVDGKGSLIIKVLEEKFTGSDSVTRNYTSARLLTKNKFVQTYGRFEARIKLPIGKGIWPAFWMLGDSIDSLGWPGAGEIDIMEYKGNEPNTIHGSLHGPGYSGGNALTGWFKLPQNEKFSDDYHVFAVEWEPNVVRFYTDGNLYETRTAVDLPAGTKWVFDHPFYILLNVAVGGNFVGKPNSSTKWPQMMAVDYVRVYHNAGSGAVSR
jgi:beta-glucanase (GH16 family)